MQKSYESNYAIELKGISKVFGTVVANDNINLNIKYGEILALLGENGSGKTTLMNMLSGIYYPDAGTISIAGNDISIGSPNDAIDYGIGMIHQHFKLVDVFSAMDNIVLGTKGKYEKPKILKEKILNISNKFGLEIEPEKKIYNMSVSEKQTVEIMKVLYRGAQILILDEPTAALDPVAEYEIYTKFNEIVGKRTAVYISHRLSSCRFCDEIAVFHEGEMIEQGSHEELLANKKGKYSELWNTQAQYYLKNA